MTDPFDPYHKWLGIAPRDQPPNHYRLLGIELFESDPEVISSAAEQRMAYVRGHQGSHSALCRRILQEITAAKLCLLVPEKKAAYDGELREKVMPAPPLLAPPASTAAPPRGTSPAKPLLIGIQGRSRAPDERLFPRRQRLRSKPIRSYLAASAAACLILLVTLFLVRAPHRPEPEIGHLQQAAEVKTAPKAAEKRAEQSPAMEADSKAGTGARESEGAVVLKDEAQSPVAARPVATQGAAGSQTASVHPSAATAEWIPHTQAPQPSVEMEAPAPEQTVDTQAQPAADGGNTNVASAGAVGTDAPFTRRKAVARVPRMVPVLAFDGKNSFITGPHVAFDDMPVFTVEAWLMRWNEHLIDEGKPGDPENQFTIVRHPDRIELFWEHGRGANVHRDVAVTRPEGWEHLAVVLDGGTLYVFSNGQRIHYEEGLPRPGPLEKHHPMVIGANQITNRIAPSATGLLRSLRISRVARYRTPFSPEADWETDDDTVLLWSALRTRGALLLDTSNNNAQGETHAIRLMRFRDDL